ncbi:MAG: tripartite tricarboxylate transporter substrate-binding protein [Nitratireductor sp.]
MASGDLEDVLARIISDQVQTDYSVPSAVVNVKGGGGVIGATQVQQAEADGYTVGVFTGNILTAHIIAGRAPFGQDAFEPLGVFINYPMALVARADLPFSDMAGLAEYAKSNPVKLAHFGFKGPPTLQTMLAAKTLGFEYAGSAAFDETNCTLLSSGDADVMITTIKLSKACLDSGEAKAIAAYTSDRISVLPDVATLEEQVPGVAAPAWAGLFVRAGTPEDVRAKISASAIKALDSDKVKAIAADTGAVIKWHDAASSAAYVADQYKRVEKLLSE